LSMRFKRTMLPRLDASGLLECVDSGVNRRAFISGHPAFATKRLQCSGGGTEQLDHLVGNDDRLLHAPWHYGPISAGRPAQTIDEIPLERCIGPGVVIDMTHKADNDPITVADMEGALAKAGVRLTEQTIVLIRTGRDRYLGTKQFWKVGTGMSAAATEWLLDHGITVMGIDQWGWDLPLKAQIAKSRATGDDTLFWEAHRVGQRRP